MAPIAKNSPQALPQRSAHSHPQRPTRRAIVPAIPLAFQKRKHQEAARAKPIVEAAPLVSSPAVVEVPSSPTPPPTETAPPIVNGSSEEQVQAQVQAEVQVPEKSEESTIPSASSVTPATPPTPAAQEEPQEAAVGDVKGESPAENEISETIPVVPTPSPSDNQSSSASRTTYQMPPAFVPAKQSNLVNQDTAQPAEQNGVNFQHQFHHTQPNSGNVMFIGYPDSSNSSPAPPLSAGNAPPYPYQQPPLHSAGQQVPLHLNGGPPMSNGYSPMGPPPPPGYYPRQDGYHGQGAPSESYGRRPVPTFGHPEGYSTSGTPQGVEGHRLMNYDPITPHSFHGSQTSAPNDQESGPHFYPQYPPPGFSNGSNGHVDEAHGYSQHRPKAPNGSQQMAPPQPGFVGPPVQSPVDHLDGLTLYILSQFGDSTLADYNLELRYADDRAQPVRIPGHGIIFARSHTLKTMMLAMGRDSNSDGPAVRNLLVESGDRFLRSDSFSLAVNRLYGGPLLDIGALAALGLSPDMHMVVSGSQADRFDLALGYAAAGHLLAIPPCVNRGIEIASHLFQWETMEKAFDFALDGGLDSQWTLRSSGRPLPCPSTYGPAVNMLIHTLVNFMITNFPAGFKLDSSVGEPNIRERRLPVVHDLRSSSQNPRLSFIKFGDHQTEENTELNFSEVVTVILSKLLIGLPFHLVKYVLTSQRLGNVQGWANVTLREEVLSDVVQERERRRLKVLNATYISNAEREANAEAWNGVGWEEWVDNVYKGTPTMERNWVGFAVPVSEA